MIENLYEDLSVHLYEGEPITKKAPTPPPITYLTQWKIVGNSEVHTLPYPDGVILPNGYKRCKYLTFDGSSYIDTGIIPEQGIGVSIKFKFLEEIGDDGIFGCRVSAWSADSFYCFRQGATGMLFVSYGNKICDSISTGNFVINANDEIELHLDSSFLSFTNGTNTLTKSISSQITKGTKTLYIGKLNGYGSKSHIILRTFVLTNGVGNTIFNGIPCLDDNNVPCLYDTVSGTSFYNDGTGTFGYEVEPQPTEIWSCGEYNPTDKRYHILVQPQGGSIVDIALPAPLKKVNNIAETIIYPHPSGASNAAIVSVLFISFSTDKLIANRIDTDRTTGLPICCRTTFTYPNAGKVYANSIQADILCNKIKNVLSVRDALNHNGEFIMVSSRTICVRNTAIEQTVEAYQSYFDSLGAIEIILPVKTPSSGGVKVSQIQEADSYSMVISQGSKAVSWSSFETDNE